MDLDWVIVFTGMVFDFVEGGSCGRRVLIVVVGAGVDMKFYVAVCVVFSEG